MMTTKIKLPVTLMRGGTSKGAYLLRKDMPPERKDWDSVLLKLMGSPDRKQIDGLGGSQSVTSKVAIIEKSSRSDADVDYTFAQVSVDKPVVSYGGNCGNISSGVGPFAIEEGLVSCRRKKQPSGSLIRIPGKSLLKRSIQQMARCVMTETILLLACPVRPLPSSLDSLIPAVPLVRHPANGKWGG